MFNFDVIIIWCSRTVTGVYCIVVTHGSKVVEKYMREIYRKQQRGGVWGGRVVPLPMEWDLGRGNANYMQKILSLVHILVYFCYFLTWRVLVYRPFFRYWSDCDWQSQREINDGFKTSGSLLFKLQEPGDDTCLQETPGNSGRLWMTPGYIYHLVLWSCWFVDRYGTWHVNLCQLSPKVVLWNIWEEEHWGELANPGHLKNDRLKWGIYSVGNR